MGWGSGALVFLCCCDLCKGRGVFVACGFLLSCMGEERRGEGGGEERT